jgi:phosphatidylserine synthase
MYIPNTITLINLAIGCLATMEAWNGRFATAAYFILISGVLDFMDGLLPECSEHILISENSLILLRIL